MNNDVIMEYKIKAHAAKWAAMSEQERAEALNWQDRVNARGKHERILLLIPILAIVVFGV